jgi:hypothetical protein
MSISYPLWAAGRLFFLAAIPPLGGTITNGTNFLNLFPDSPEAILSSIDNLLRLPATAIGFGGVAEATGKLELRLKK